jgi:hypothetical protein
MKKLIAAFALVAASLLPARAIAQMTPDHSYNSPKATITVDHKLVVGTATLEPGDYKFQCRTFGDKTFLVVTSVETGKEVVRVPCVREVLTNAVTDSQMESLIRPDGQRVLVSVRIRGESFAHYVVLN